MGPVRYDPVRCACRSASPEYILPLGLPVQLLPPCKSWFAVRLGTTPLRWIAILGVDQCFDQAHGEDEGTLPRVAFLSASDLKKPTLRGTEVLLSCVPRPMPSGEL